MINKKSIFTALFLFSLQLQQLGAGPRFSTLNSASTIPTQQRLPLVGKRSESKTVPEYFKFKQEQTRTFENIPDYMKYVIGQYVGFDQSVSKSCSLNPFHYAISKQDGNAVQILVALKADWHDKKCKYVHQKTTVLHAAIQQYTFAFNDAKAGSLLDTQKQKDALVIVDYLLRKEIGINKIGCFRQTPIYEAIESGNKNIVQRLLTAQADLTVINHWNNTPLDAAKKQAMQPLNGTDRKNLYTICTILEQAGAPSSVILTPMPTDAVINQQAIVTCQEPAEIIPFAHWNNF